MSATLERTLEAANMEHVDLTSCDREPIHALGAVQSFGMLLAVSTDWIVTRASENVPDFLGRSVNEIIGTSLVDLITPEAIHAIRGQMQNLRGRDAVERVFRLPLVEGGDELDVAIHLAGPYIIIEGEAADHERLDAISTVRSMVTRLDQTETIELLCREGARQMRALSGFDRVMVYRFDNDGSGEVIAESTAPSLEPFLGLRYPASDIPKQARALYLRSMLRIIHDVEDEGVAILPQRGVDGEPVDLSLSVLRAVSPIHLEYLTNMGVRASMSVSIVVEGKLWGLFACHHMSPRRISLERRTASELFGQMFAYLLDGRTRETTSRYEERARAAHDRLMSAVVAGDSTLDAVMNHLDDLSEVIACDGVGAWVDGRVVLQGQTPTREEFDTLVRFLNRAPAGQPFASDELSSVHPPAADYVERAAGVLAIPISRHPRDYLVFFRREVARSVRWAGNPEKPAQLGPNGIRLTPRKSFEAWREVTRGRSEPWTPADMRIADMLRATLLEVVLRMSDAASAERRRAQDRQELLIAELNHRVRNILGLIRGLVNQTRGAATTVEDFASTIGGRVQALARAHEQITGAEWGPGALRDLIASEAEAYGNGTGSRIRVEGTDVLLEPQAFSALALVIHELMTNAAKYGALTDNSGRVQISWKFRPNGDLVIDWRERGGPAVQAPTRRGFGSTVIERSIPFELKGETEIRYELTGVEARMVIPGAYARENENMVSRLEASNRNEPEVEAGLSGHVLLVEDNMLIALDAEDMLAELGADTVVTAASVDDAMRQIDMQTPSFALLDVNLGNGTSLPVAERLSEMGVPFMFASGYGTKVPLPDTMSDVQMVAKPYTASILKMFLAKM